MATRGRKPKHPGLELLDGGRGKKAAKPDVESPTDYPPMREDFEHVELWGQLHSLFEENGTPIRSTDVFAIEDLCCMIAEVQAMRETLSSGRRTVQGERNPKALRAHPIAAQLKATRDALWRGFERFGMTPVDSGRLPLKSKAKTPRERVMAGFAEWDRKQGAGDRKGLCGGS